MLNMFRSVAEYFGVTLRDKDWPKVRKEHLKNNPTCAACGSKNKLEVHHIRPFHLHPELELNPDNLITLCDSHHLTFGHLMNFQSFNVDVIKDSKWYLEKVKSRPIGVSDKEKKQISLFCFFK